jgi:hypothetical protein
LDTAKGAHTLSTLFLISETPCRAFGAAKAEDLTNILGDEPRLTVDMHRAHSAAVEVKVQCMVVSDFHFGPLFGVGCGQ